MRDHQRAQDSDCHIQNDAHFRFSVVCKIMCVLSNRKVFPLLLPQAKMDMSIRPYKTQLMKEQKGKSTAKLRQKSRQLLLGYEPQNSHIGIVSFKSNSFLLVQ